MIVLEILFALIIIVLLVALPFIFKSIFKTRNFMGYSIGVCCSVLVIATLIIIFLFGLVICEEISKRPDEHKMENRDFFLYAIIINHILIIPANIVIFLFIFFYTKRISNPNQPYNSVFMFIAGYLLPQFVFIYLYFILTSFTERIVLIPGILNFMSDALFLNEIFFLFYMVQFAGTIMLSMLHHRKVNKSILYILLVCYFLPLPFYLIAFLMHNQYLLIPNVVMIFAIFGLAVFFYCKYANHEYPNSEILEPNDI